MEKTISSYHVSPGQMMIESDEIKAAQKDLSKFSVLYDRYYLQIFRFILKRIDSEELTADLTQQVFYKAMKSLKEYGFKGLPFSSWLYRIARNEINMEMRSSRVKRTVSVQTEQLLLIAEETGLDEKEERIAMMMQIVMKIEPEELELVEMHYFENRPHKEIAEILNISEGNAKVRLHRVIQKMKTKLI
jgi:RNA polymerase sigma-70 factor, ECF subfamily